MNLTGLTYKELVEKLKYYRSSLVNYPTGSDLYTDGVRRIKEVKEVLKELDRSIGVKSPSGGSYKPKPKTIRIPTISASVFINISFGLHAITIVGLLLYAYYK